MDEDFQIVKPPVGGGHIINDADTVDLFTY